MSRDPSLRALVLQLVRAGRAAPLAVWEGFGAYRDMRASDPLRGTPSSAELDDVRDRVVARLLGEPPPGIPDPGTPYVLVARDLSPAVTSTLDPERVLAFVTERGGPTSHTAVLAKALGIPAVVACPGIAALATGQRVAVDGSTGVVTADPDAELVGSVSAQARTPALSATGPGRTRDGRSVPLLAAVGGKGEVDDAVAAGAEGVGVFRTEFCFLDRAEPPSVAEQAEAYREVFAAFPGLPVTVRTLDIGADKPVSFVSLGDQPNPALGVRGLRVARRHPQLLTDQLVAIARAARESEADVRVMAPMVATTAEAVWFASEARGRRHPHRRRDGRDPRRRAALRGPAAGRRLRLRRQQRPGAVRLRHRPRRRRARRPARPVAAGVPRPGRDGAARRRRRRSRRHRLRRGGERSVARGRSWSVSARTACR